MSTRCHVSTRKGLFTLERGASGWDVARTSFRRRQRHARDARPAERPPARRAQSRPLRRQAASLDATAAPRGTRSPAPKYPEKPEGYTPKTPVEGTPVEWSLKLVWALEPGGADEPGVIWCGTLPGGLFSRTTAASRGRSTGRCGTIRGARNGSAAAPISPASTRSASIRAIPVTSRSACRAAACGPRATAERAGSSPRRACARSSCRPNEQFEAERAGPAHGGAVPRQPGRAVGAASQRHLQVDRRRGSPGPRSPASSRRRLALPSRCIRTTRSTAWFVPAVQGREALSRRRPRGGHPHPRRRADVRDAHARPAAAARLRSGLPPRPRRGRNRSSSSPSARPPARCGSASDGGDSWQMASSHLPPIYAVHFEQPR